MAFKVELYTHEMPVIFNRFKKIIGDKCWLNRVDLIVNEIKGRNCLAEHLYKENHFAFLLSKYSFLDNERGRTPLDKIENREFYPAISFAAQAMSIIEHAPYEQRNALIRRVQGAFSNPDDMRALQLEILAATHFVRRGCSVSWPEMDKTGNFDLLVSGIGRNGLEVECKSISHDKGKRIHQRERIEFFDYLSAEIKAVIKNLKLGLVVVLTIPKRLPSDAKGRSALSRKVVEQILASNSKLFSDGVEVRISEFDFSSAIDKSSNSPPDRGVIDKITETVNCDVMIIGNSVGGGIMFAMKSSQDDTIIKAIFDTLKKSAKKQLSKSRAGMFLVGFYDLEMNGLNEMAEHDANYNNAPTPLRIGVSKLLSSTNCGHVAGVHFLDEGELMPKDNGDVVNSGTAYTFKNEQSLFWDESLNGLFENSKD